MSEQALASVYEVRHYATVAAGVACGKQDADLVTTCRQHVTCRACLAALGPAGHYAPPRPTLGDLAVKELAELRADLKAWLERMEAAVDELPDEEQFGPRRLVADLRGLLAPTPVQPP